MATRNTNSLSKLLAEKNHLLYDIDSLTVDIKERTAEAKELRKMINEFKKGLKGYRESGSKSKSFERMYLDEIKKREYDLAGCESVIKTDKLLLSEYKRKVTAINKKILN